MNYWEEVVIAPWMQGEIYQLVQEQIWKQMEEVYQWGMKEISSVLLLVVVVENWTKVAGTLRI